MSRFIDKLNQASKAASPLGFKATPAAQSKPKLLLIASLAKVNLDGMADYMAGADAGLILISKLSPGAKTIAEALQAVPDIPWGGWLEDVDREEVNQIINTGCDFVVFPASSTALAILQGDKVGKILEVAASLSDGLLRAIDKLPIDAVLIGSEQEEGQFLTWHHLMYFQHCADLLTKPLLASIPSNVTASELQALWTAGVDGVVVGVGLEQPAGRLIELSKVIDGLTLPSPYKRRKPAASVPYIGGNIATVSEEPEEE
jgi:hypothetical protein